MMDTYNLAAYYDIDMQPIDMKDISTTFLDPPSIPFLNNWDGGMDGIPPIFKGSDIQQRPIPVVLHMSDNGYLDFQLLRSELYKKLSYNKPFYLVDLRQKGKRFKVVLSENFSPKWLSSGVQVNFITVDVPFAESIGTTQDIHQRGIDAEDELWGYGMGLIAEDESLIYTHSTNSFKIYNAGSASIHPFRQELKITITDVIGSTDYLQLKNVTNGSTFRVNEAVTSTQTILIDGPNITSNGLQFLRKTNKQFIELEPGWNEFTVTGATSATVSFDFPFYYL